MANQTDLRRRWTGAILLTLSVAMLLAGETFLSGLLGRNPWITIGYWSCCFLFVILAIAVALLDMAIMRKRLRAEQRGLVEETVQKILRDKKTRNRPEDSDSNGDTSSRSAS